MVVKTRADFYNEGSAGRILRKPSGRGDAILQRISGVSGGLVTADRRAYLHE
jgi:hypothetical protein